MGVPPITSDMQGSTEVSLQLYQQYIKKQTNLLLILTITVLELTIFILL